MKKVEVGKVVPNFRAKATGGEDIELKGLRGQNVVIYFYPKDDTPGCTKESCEFGELHRKFLGENTVVLGVSRDSLASHEKFKTKYRLPFELLSDEDEKLCGLFDVIRDKNMYGKKVRGIERSTFLIDADGRLRREWRKVKPEGHAAEVRAALAELHE